METSEPSRYGGMTVNERLCEAGVLAAFERAARAGDTVRLEQILASVDLQPDGIRDVIEWIYTSPQSPYRRNSP